MGVAIGGFLEVRQLIISNQQSALQARQANTERQNEIKGYIKCIFLAKFDSPEAVKPDATRVQVEAALDKCAKIK